MPKINYLNKDFKTLKDSLINFAKTYFPETYSDFNPSSPGMMFIDMAAYIGDVLSYYIDDTFKESLLSKAENEENILEMSQALGYKPRTTTVASTDLDVFIVIPSISTAGGASDDYNPDWRFAFNIEPGMEIESSTNSNIKFITEDYVTFNNSGSYEENSDIMVYSYTGSPEVPANYLLKQTIKVISATKVTKEFSVPSIPKRYLKIQLPDTDIIKIESVVDSLGNDWYEVPFLAQDIIYEDELNNLTGFSNDPDVGGINETQYLMRLKKVNKRYITKINSNYKTELQFGSGISSIDDENLIPNPFNIGSALIESRSGKDSSIDPSNFLYTKTYGEVPYNTTLTITYWIGGGIKSNIPSNDLVTISSVEWDENESFYYKFYPAVTSNVKTSLAIVNPNPAIGGKGRESIEEIRQNTMALLSSQRRAVTKKDYIFRTYSMPGKYGSIAKAYIAQDKVLNKANREWINNPLALDLFVLAYDINKNLVVCNNATKQNLKTYLNQYRMLTDAINILDAYIINIGVKFDIVSLANYNKNDVVLRCIDKIYEYFNIDNWQINQPILISEIINLLFTVKGVQNVNNVEIINLWNEDDGYSGNSYNIKEATKNGIVYPSKDPSIFELKNKNDIKGKSR